MKYAAFAAYFASILLANALVVTIGTLPVGFGLVAPAGVLCVGVTLALRDKVQDDWGRGVTYSAIIVGCAVSALFAGPFALASFVAFLASETADMLVYTPLRAQGRILLAIALSNTVGAIVDSAVFLQIGFGSQAFLAGQVLGKVEATLAVLAIVFLAQQMQKRRLAVLG